jgi:hypothetical protein
MLKRKNEESDDQPSRPDLEPEQAPEEQVLDEEEGDVVNSLRKLREGQPCADGAPEGLEGAAAGPGASQSGAQDIARAAAAAARTAPVSLRPGQQQQEQADAVHANESGNDTGVTGQCGGSCGAARPGQHGGAANGKNGSSDSVSLEGFNGFFSCLSTLRECLEGRADHLVGVH